jgi:Cu+-exporting ATPase
LVGSGVGARNGILIKGGEALETTHKIDTVIFDKTGTITTGKPEVIDIIPIGKTDKNKLLAIAASVEKGSQHPLGDAIVRCAQKTKIKTQKITEFSEFSGFGVSAKVGGDAVIIGNKKLMAQEKIKTDEIAQQMKDLSTDGKTPILVAVNKKIAGIITIADTVRPTSKQAIAQLQKMGIEVAMLTGDGEATANAIAKQVGITRIIAEVLPTDKANEVARVQNEGKRVGMIGDGINDAPALATADIGIAIGNGTDIAIESADIVLMRNDLNDVPTAIRLSKATIRNIKQNLFWAFGYNVVGIPIACLALLNPMFAALAMSLSSVSVVLNALRLRFFR